MINTLYEKFQHWSAKGSVYIISDPHFLDTDMNWRWSLIQDYPFPVLDWMNEEYIADCIANYIVYKINKVVHKNDTLIILGDIGNTKYITQLKAGYKVLIKGNHDSGTENYLKREYCGYPHCKEPDCFNCRHYKAKLFDEVYEGPIIISDKLVLSHEPFITVPQFLANIHGHVHTGSNLSDNSNGFLCVSCEQINFTPVSLGQLIKEGLLSNIDNIHRHTIDRATERRKERDD